MFLSIFHPASCWTNAGGAAPVQNPETSTAPIAERLAAITSTGRSGFGLAQDDIAAAHLSANKPLLAVPAFTYSSI